MLTAIKKHLFSSIMLFFSLCFFTGSMILASTGTTAFSQYIAMNLHMLSIVLVAVIFLKELLTRKILHTMLDTDEILVFACVVLTAEVVSFFVLQSYPYIAVGDEVRDAGLDAMTIATGASQHFFEYGNYNGYGRIIPYIASYFYTLFGSSVLTYRFPAALVGWLDILTLYILLRLTTNKITALLGSLTLLVLPLHLFYARTELVVIFDSFWTSILLLLFYLWVEKKTVIRLVMLASIIGFASNFHTAVRIVAGIITVGVFLLGTKEFLYQHKIRHILKKIASGVGFILFCFVGFGPMLFFSSSQNFLESGQYAFSTNAHQGYSFPSFAQWLFLGNNYVASFLVWFINSTTSHYRYPSPILTGVFAVFFFIGIGYILWKIKHPFFALVTTLIFLLPFTNSAITSAINADHRLLPMLPLAALAIGYGLFTAGKIIRVRAGIVVLQILFGVYLIYQAYWFFTAMPAIMNRDVREFVAMDIIQLLQSQDGFVNTVSSHPLSENICLIVSPSNAQNLQYEHHQEQYEYFLPTKTIMIDKNPSIPDNEAYIFHGGCPTIYSIATQKAVTTCTGANNFFCPIGYTGNIVLHYQ